MNLLVTGGCGFIESNFVRYWLQHHIKSDVVGYEKLTYAGRKENLHDLRENSQLSLVMGAISDQQLVRCTCQENDIDLRCGSQEGVWREFIEGGQRKQLTGTGEARNTQGVLRTPDNGHLIEVEPNVDMLTAGLSVNDSLSIFNQADLANTFKLLWQKYGVVLVDSAPSLADGLLVSQHADAAVMVSEYGFTNTKGVKSALRRAERSGPRVIGAVTNKVDVRQGNVCGYFYQQRL